MAEALAVVGLVSAIVQFVDFGNRVVDRLNDFRQCINQVPKTFRKVSEQLPLLIDTFRRTQSQANAGQVGEETAKALKPVVDGCLAQIKQLEDMLAKTLPLEKDSTWSRRVKALASLALDKIVLQITSDLESHMRVLTYYQTTSCLDLSSQLVLREVSHPPKLDAKTLWEPCFMVKFEQDENFIGREDILMEIDRRLMEEQHRVAIAGIGGVGKSQIAIEYCYRYRYDHPEANIFWVHASNYARFTEGYHEIARELALPDIDNPDTDVLRLVLKWLNNDANGPWLLVLDNADDIETFFGSSRHASSGQDGQLPTALVSYLPQRSKGAMIITTRDKRIGDRLAMKEMPIVVPRFEMEDARRLLQKTIREDELHDEDSMALLRALDFLPLAITQAAAYIRENHVGLVDYLESLRASDNEMKDLLEENLYDPGRDLEIRNSVFQTWKISFDRIRKQSPRAAEILSLMAVLDRQAIQDKLVRGDDDSKNDFTTAIGTLKAFSLISEEKRGAAFRMHRLVQLSTQRWLELEGAIKDWQEKALTAVSKCCPVNGRYENWTAWEAINPHIQVTLGVVFYGDSSLLQRASVLSRAAAYSLEQGRYETAYRDAMEGFEIRQKLLEGDHVDTLASVSILASVLQKQGKYEAAEEMNQMALNRRENILGLEHPDTLTSVSNLAWVLEKLGKYKAAEKMNQRALKGREKVLGPEFPLTLTSVSNLASVLERQGKYKAAERMNRRALDGYEKALGPEHPDTLTIVNNLASVLGRQGKYKAAEEMNRRALDGSEKALGPDHPETLTSVSNLALVLWKQGQHEAAQEMNYRALNGREKVLGLEHPDTLSSVSNIAGVLWSQGKCEAAKEMSQRALDGRQNVLGHMHPLTLMSVSNMAGMLQSEGEYKKAEDMNRRALEGFEKMLGPEHPDTVTIIDNLASVLWEQSKYEPAIEMYQRALDWREKELGPDHQDTITSVYGFAYLLRSQKQYNNASILYQRAYSEYKKTLGPDHPASLECLEQYNSLLEESKSN